MATATATLPAEARFQPQANAPPARLQLGGAAAMQATIDDLNAIRSFIAAEMVEGLDYGKIPGTGTRERPAKPTLLQPGAQKILMYCNAYPDYEIQTRDFDSGHVEYIVKTKLISRVSQTMIGSGIGLCTTLESKYRWRQSSRSCPSCGCEAIVKGKEEYGGGWVCFKARGGCGAKFRDDDPAVTSQAAGRVENPDIYDQRNTVLKMSKKRSLIDAALGLGCLSELFTQDLEDFAHEPAARSPAPDAGRESPNRTHPGKSTPAPAPAAREVPPRREVPPPAPAPRAWRDRAREAIAAIQQGIDRALLGRTIGAEDAQALAVDEHRVAIYVAKWVHQQNRLPLPGKTTSAWARDALQRMLDDGNGWEEWVEAGVAAYADKKLALARQVAGKADHDQTLPPWQESAPAPGGAPDREPGQDG